MSERSLDRYARQIRFAPLGEEGQRTLLSSRALVCGCGALGSVIANTLARAGVGSLRLVDRDFLELNNLQRQVLYDEDDVAAGLPKAIAAKNRLSRINSEIEIEAFTIDVNHRNIGELVAEVDVIVDGTDNFDTRFLLNDAALHYGIPWIYGGCIGSEGQTLAILPGETPCLRCLMSDTPPPGTTPTCDSAGILGPVINVIASLQAAEAIKILAGKREAVGRKLTVIDVWDSTVRQVNVDSLRDSGDCEACVKRDFAWLRGERGSYAAVLCGRNAVQISFPERSAISFDELAARWSGLGEVRRNPFLIRLQTAKYLLTLFADGRAIIGGTEEIAEAKSVYAKYVGN